MATQVMTFVRNSIQDGSMTPDTWYSVYQIAEKLHISRSPVRDGLLRLEEAGLVKFSRNRGFQIILPRPDDVAEIFALRLGIEPACAACAARDRTEEQLQHMQEISTRMATAAGNDDETSFFDWDQQLHRFIAEAGHSHRGAHILDTLRFHTRLLSDSTVRSYRTMDHVHSEHQPILDAITNSNPTAAHTAMTEHLTATGKLLLRQTILKQEPSLNNDQDKLKEFVETTWEKHAALTNL